MNGSNRIQTVSVKTITSQKVLNPTILTLLDELVKKDHGRFWSVLEKGILAHKVKFPLLEHLAIQIAQKTEPAEQSEIMDWLLEKAYIGSFPIIGKLLQLQLTNGLKHPYEQAIQYIIKGNEWYACDIISERVFGYGTLVDFETSYSFLKNMGDHPNLWIQRAIGIAGHYAVKKGLEKKKAEILFQLMLNHGHKKQLYIKKGIGWAAKTTAKYHPDIIEARMQEIERRKDLSKWFQRKISIGLAMAKKNDGNA